MKQWILDPHSGGSKITVSKQAQITERVLAYANKNYSGKFNEIIIRFRNQFCYIGAVLPGDDFQTKLCRLRYFSAQDEFSVSFYTYSSETYKPAFMESGEWFGSVEQGFDIGATYFS